jgi:probable phosphomutase (TIGR03848 family)
MTPKRNSSSTTSTQVLLIRHGRTPSTGTVLPGRAKGLNLSDDGRAQAEQVADRLTRAGIEIAAVYSSPLERTRQTAAPIAKAYDTKVIADKGLLECDFGEWTGRKLTELAKLPEWQTVQRTPSQFRFPQGESFLEMQARIVSCIAKLTAAHPGQTIALVSHADPIKAALVTAIGSPFDFFQRITVAPCSVSAVTYGRADPLVLTINSTNLGDLKPS